MSSKKTEKKHGGGGNPVAGHSNPRDPRAEESSEHVQEQDNIQGPNQMPPTLSQRLNQDPKAAVDFSGQEASSISISGLLSETSGLRTDESGANLLDQVEELEEKNAEQRKIIEAKVEKKRILQNKRTQFQPFWDSMGAEIKKSEFLDIRIQDLRNHLSTTYSQHQDFNSLIETFNQAISYGENNNNNCWEFWQCLHCDDTPIFTSNEQHLGHVVDNHGGGQPLNYLVFEDYALLSDWLEMVLNGRWVPLDLVLALPVIEELTENCSIQDINSKEWPLLNDGSQRAPLLNQIRSRFLQLSVKQCLSSTNVKSVVKYAAEALKSLIREPEQQAHLTKIARSHISICFLSEIDLEALLQFLQSLSKACDLLEDFPDKDGSFHSTLNKVTKFQVKENIAFSADKSRLLLDERLIADEIQPQRYFLPSPATSASTYPFLSWLFYVGSDSIWEELELWKQLKAEKNNLVTQFLKVHEKTGELLQPLFDERHNEAEMQKACSRLRALCEERGPSYTDLLTIRQEALSQDQSHSAQCEAGATQFVFDSIVSALASRSRMPSLQERDTMIPNALDCGIGYHFGKWNEADSKIMMIGSVKNNLSAQFMPLSGLDYRAILLPIIRSFLQGKMEKLALKEDNEDTSEKQKDAGADIS